MKNPITYTGCADCDAEIAHDSEHCYSFGVYLCCCCASQRERDYARDLMKTPAWAAAAKANANREARRHYLPITPLPDDPPNGQSADRYLRGCYIG